MKVDVISENTQFHLSQRVNIHSDDGILRDHAIIEIGEDGIKVAGAKSTLALNSASTSIEAFFKDRVAPGILTFDAQGKGIGECKGCYITPSHIEGPLPSRPEE